MSSIMEWVGPIGVGILLLLAFSVSPVKAFLAKLPRAHLCVLTSLLGLIFLGQALSQSRLIYPIVSWDMFSVNGDAPEVTSSVMIGLTAQNERVRLSIPELFPVVHFILPPISDPVLEKIVQASAKAYNLNHPEAPVVKVEVGTMTVRLGAPNRPEWTLSAIFTVGSAPSKS